MDTALLDIEHSESAVPVGAEELETLLDSLQRYLFASARGNDPVEVLRSVGSLAHAAGALIATVEPS